MENLSFQKASHTRELWMVCAIYLAFGICLGTILVHIVPYATDQGMSATSAANMLVIVGGLKIASRTVTGGVADKFGNGLSIISSLVLLSVAFFGLLIIKETWVFYSCAAVFGLAYGALMVLLPPLVANLFGLGSLGTITGIVTCAIAVGGAIGSAVVGHIFDITTSYKLGFSMCAAVSIIAAMLAFAVKASHRKG